MLVLMLFAFIAGIVTVLSPCILPVLPIVLSGSVVEGKQRPLGVVTGFVVSFTFFTLFLSSLVQFTHIPADILRSLSVFIIIGFGVSLLFPQFQTALEQAFTFF
jgi:cytochrome c biogenesis protein CcdA